MPRLPYPRTKIAPGAERVGFGPAPFTYLLRFAYNPRNTLPAARIKKPTNRSVNPVVM